MGADLGSASALGAPPPLCVGGLAAPALGALPLFCALGGCVLGFGSALGALPLSLLCEPEGLEFGSVSVPGALSLFCALGGSVLGSAAAGERNTRAKSGRAHSLLRRLACRERAVKRMQRPLAREKTDTRRATILMQLGGNGAVPNDKFTARARRVRRRRAISCRLQEAAVTAKGRFPPP